MQTERFLLLINRMMPQESLEQKILQLREQVIEQEEANRGMLRKIKGEPEDPSRKQKSLSQLDKNNSAISLKSLSKENLELEQERLINQLKDLKEKGRRLSKKLPQSSDQFPTIKGPQYLTKEQYQLDSMDLNYRITAMENQLKLLASKSANNGNGNEENIQEINRQIQALDKKQQQILVSVEQKIKQKPQEVKQPPENKKDMQAIQQLINESIVKFKTQNDADFKAFETRQQQQIKQIEIKSVDIKQPVTPSANKKEMETIQNQINEQVQTLKSKIDYEIKVIDNKITKQIAELESRINEQLSKTPTVEDATTNEKISASEEHMKHLTEDINMFAQDVAKNFAELSLQLQQIKKTNINHKFTGNANADFYTFAKDITEQLKTINEKLANKKD